MFQKLLQTYPFEGQIKQKQNSLRQILLDYPFNGPLLLAQLSGIYDKVISIFIEHPQIIVQYIFQHLAIQDCLKLMEIQNNEFQKDSKQNQFKKQQNGFIRILNDIGTSANNSEYIEWFSKMYSKYSSIQKLLIFLRQLSINYQHKYTDQYFPQFLADFIKSSAICIQSYLKIKIQAPKFDIDYIEHGQKIVKNTQIWVKNFYINLLKNLRIPKQNSKLKNSLLNGVCDIIGALMQVQRQGNIQFSICNQILKQCYFYIRKISSIDQFNQIYLRYLQQNQFKIVHKKIVLPNLYPSHMVTYPKPSYCFIMYSFIKQSFSLYSKKKLYAFLIPLANQLIAFQFQIKHQVQKWFVQVTSQIQIKTFFEGKFPLSILWFNSWKNIQKGNEKIFKQIDNLYEKIKTNNVQSYLNNLSLLANCNFEDQLNEINEFIGLKAVDISRNKSLKIIDFGQKYEMEKYKQKRRIKMEINI